MIIRFNKDIVNKTPKLFDYIESKGTLAFIYYILNSNLRKASAVSSWADSFINNPGKNLIAAASEIETFSDPDYQMTLILKWVQKNIKYTPDTQSWKMNEYWQTPDETLKLKTGDCEDGAILIYALAIQKGISANRLLIMAGNVNGGGHCWLAYRPMEYPLNWAFMDWCYWFDHRTPNVRTKYYILDTTIHDDPLNNYYSIWFAFNHIKSYRGIANNGA